MKTKTDDSLPKTLPGAVCAQMIRCGKPNCKCARGVLHGPYFYHFMRVDGALVKRYIKSKDVSNVRRVCERRRAQERWGREFGRLSARQLVKMADQIGESEKLLSLFLEALHG